MDDLNETNAEDTRRGKPEDDRSSARREEGRESAVFVLRVLIARQPERARNSKSMLVEGANRKWKMAVAGAAWRCIQ